MQLLITLFIWGITFFTDTRLFTDDVLNMGSLPMDANAVPFMYLFTKVMIFCVLYGLISFFLYAWKHKKLLFSFAGFFMIYITLFVICYPGWYMSDDLIILGYATRYYPVYWHHYLTSLYYMVGMSLFPISTGPIVLHDICLSLVFSYIFYETELLYQTRIRYIILLCGIMPFVLLSGLMCFRPVLYAPFFLFFFAFLFFENKRKASLSVLKLIWFSSLTAFLCCWRSEGIILALFCLILLHFTYSLNKINFLLFILSFTLFFSLIEIPQQTGEIKYYGRDYLIITTVRPLSLIIKYREIHPECERDWENIGKIVDLDFLKHETLSCSSYHNSNSKNNKGHYTETGADKETQNAYLKSAAHIILKNMDLYLTERLQLFFATNSIPYDNEKLLFGEVQTETSSYPLFQSDKDYGKKLLFQKKGLPLEGSEAFVQFLFRYGGEAYIPLLILMLIGIIFSSIKKAWFIFYSFLSIAAREAIIFFTAPVGFIQYNYSAMLVIFFLFLLLVIEHAENALKVSDHHS